MLAYLVAGCVWLGQPVATDVVAVPIGDRTIEFLSGPAAHEAITEDQRDPYFRLLSRLDMEVRLREPLGTIPRDSAMKRLKAQYVQAVQPSTEAERAAVTQACQQVYLRSKQVCPQFVPQRWRFVKTDGSEEAGAAYTRGDTIILSVQRMAAGGPAELARLVAHETAHVFTRQNPKWRDKLYARLGFRHVGPIDWGNFDAHRLTNPDAPETEHIISVTLPSFGPTEAALLMYSPHQHYSPANGRRIFDYVEVGLFPVTRVGDRYHVAANAQSPQAAVSLTAAGGFFEQVGRNTQYLLAPEEILAENLALLFTRQSDALGAVPDPALIRDLAKILAEPPKD